MFIIDFKWTDIYRKKGTKPEIIIIKERWRLQASKRIESDTNVRTSKHEEIYE